MYAWRLLKLGDQLVFTVIAGSYIYFAMFSCVHTSLCPSAHSQKYMVAKVTNIVSGVYSYCDLKSVKSGQPQIDKKDGRFQELHET